MHPSLPEEVAFSYKLQRMGWLPIIPVTLISSRGQIRSEAYVDSGALYSIFRIELAEILGLDQKHAKKRMFVVGDGTHIPAFIYPLKVEIGASLYTAEIAFSEKLKVGFNLLGRKDIFSRFREVAFQDRARQVVFRP